jgi:tRNA(fMet)-specific endonuclease VapC
MLVLDTDHLTELGYDRPRGRRLAARIEASGIAAVTTIISVEEQLRGWLARIARITDVHHQVVAYAELGARVNFLAAFTFVPWDDEAATMFKQFPEEVWERPAVVPYLSGSSRRKPHLCEIALGPHATAA